MNAPLDTAIVGDIVANDFRTAAIFEGFGIDFCCGGKRSVAEACSHARIAPTVVIEALAALPASAGAPDAAHWPVDRLIDHIVETHHVYVRDALPRITHHLAKLASAHAERHPELAIVARTFAAISAELTQHLVKEEHILFPYVRDLATHAACGRPASPFGTVENPIRMMEREHRDAADGLETIRELTHDYTTPADGCRTYSVTMQELADFERDLHRHVHLENNVLFPRAVELESRR
jgi:regulator of cell morphogenesis and NO signaling